MLFLCRKNANVFYFIVQATDEKCTIADMSVRWLIRQHCGCRHSVWGNTIVQSHPRGMMGSLSCLHLYNDASVGIACVTDHTWCTLMDRWDPWPLGRRIGVDLTGILEDAWRNLLCPAVEAKKHIFLHWNASNLVLKFCNMTKSGGTIPHSKFWGTCPLRPPSDLRPWSSSCTLKLWVS